MPDNNTNTSEAPVQLATGLETLNRTHTILNDDNDDPLNITPAKAPASETVVQNEPGTTTAQEDQPTTEAPEEEKVTPEEEELKYREKFTTDLDSILEEKTGVNLQGITEVLAELLQWRNDILALELEQKQSQQPRSNIPTAVRPQGRESVQSRNYDFRQSEIDSMDTATYARNRQAITNAYLSGRVLRDR